MEASVCRLSGARAEMGHCDASRYSEASTATPSTPVFVVRAIWSLARIGMASQIGAGCSDGKSRLTNSQTQGLRPRTPEESLLTELPLASCQRLPSGRH